MTHFILPYEPQYVGHREAERRHQETKRWLRLREKSLHSLSIVPEHPGEDTEAPVKESRPVCSLSQARKPRR
jgi:hypothetical protein